MPINAKALYGLLILLIPIIVLTLRFSGKSNESTASSIEVISTGPSISPPTSAVSTTIPKADPLVPQADMSIAPTEK